jgi:hypothetical protein
MIDTLGKGDAKATLLNVAERVGPKDDVLIIVRDEDGGYTSFGTAVSYENTCGMIMHLLKMRIEQT